ncbi:RNA polymerase sigma factor [Kurthia sibirica]|uniref:RNA polymerase subunit sigma-70 n=1 Tax=Kurthia sibirica TaxID=202750 RepID=A0A2U3AR84_9BACL|nr:sigma-70 family RNA polymerase sigma factor [Kurthia sibirica]PWI26965.1 RNA polymerase subunit sigma-70 [Kurthia sibirica]GEK32488.1 RNA polymerase sigma factor SigV [Kurthia sibirica]
MSKRNAFLHEDEFIQFIRTNKDRFYFLAYSYTKNEQDALDIIQDSIQKAMLALHNLDKVESMKSWFYKIVVRTALDFIRKHKRIQVTDDTTLHHLTTNHEDHYENTDLQFALSALPQKYREIIILHYFEDLKLSEVATVLDTNISTIKSRLYRALKLLKIQLDDTKGEMTNDKR